ncbi:MAG: hypothetical protein E6Q63_00070, partial [Novosphingobium sp.]
MTRLRATIALVMAALTGLATSPARADDGYTLWLRPITGTSSEMRLPAATVEAPRRSPTIDRAAA